MTNSPFTRKLKYKLPRIELRLVHESNQPKNRYPVTSPKDAAIFLEPLRHQPEEHFVSLHLNSKHEIIGLHEVSHGTLSSSLVHPREVFKAALLANSHAILVCHNHPSGSPLTPSKHDIDTTEQLVAAGRVLGVDILDHLIVGPLHEAFSLREHFPDLWSSGTSPA